MKRFEMSQLRAALNYAMDGGQALHVHTMNQGHPLFERYPLIGHLFDQDKKRLVHLARRLGVRVIKIEHEGTPKQHIDLCGKPFERAIAMVDGAKSTIKHADALAAAESLVAELRPLCERIEISGELRRLEEEIHRIDILVQLPFMAGDLAGLDELLEAMRTDGMVQYTTLGAYSKKFTLPAIADLDAQIYVVADPATWGVRSVTMTGPDDFAHWMVSRRCSGGVLPNHLYVRDGVVRDSRTNARFITPEEADFFDICCLPWIRPQNRVARWSK